MRVDAATSEERSLVIKHDDQDVAFEPKELVPTVNEHATGSQTHAVGLVVVGGGHLPRLLAPPSDVEPFARGQPGLGG